MISSSEIDTNTANIDKLRHATDSTLMAWSNVEISLDSRLLLRLGNGDVKKKHLLGVIGPSGSGKSTFLNVLAGRLKDSRLKVTSDISCLQDNEISFVYQDDSFFSMITVEETLLLAAQLRQLAQYDHIKNMNVTMSVLVEDVMNSLQLKKIAKSQVGDPKVSRGISGGERKRLAVASELLGNPKLLLVDEGTSGLDSFQALQVMRLLSDIAKEKDIAVVVSIHQPRSSIWSLFDDILLLTPLGKVAYFGPRKDVLNYFKNLGYECPDQTNPAEFLIDLVSLDMQSPTSKDQIERLVVSFEEMNKNVKTAVDKEVVQSKQYSVQTVCRNIFGKIKRSAQRFSLLFLRSAKQAFRDKATNIVRLLVSGLLAAVIGQLYGRKDDNLYQDSVSDRVNIFAQAAINVGMLSMIKALQLFKREKSIIDRERLSNQYSSFEYLLAKLCSEMPMDAAVASAFGIILHIKSNLLQDRTKFVSILSLLGVVSSTLGLAIGALFQKGDTSLAIGPALMVVYVLMGTIGPAGNSNKQLPWFLAPLRYFSPFRWACEGLAAAEFRNRNFVPVKRNRIQLVSMLKGISGPKVTGGDRTLEALGIADSTYSNSVSKLKIMFGIHSLVCLLGLIFQQPKGN